MTTIKHYIRVRLQDEPGSPRLTYHNFSMGLMIWILIYSEHLSSLEHKFAGLFSQPVFLLLRVSLRISFLHEVPSGGFKTNVVVRAHHLQQGIRLVDMKPDLNKGSKPMARIYLQRVGALICVSVRLS